MAEKNPRQIRYNLFIDTAEQEVMRYTWAMVLINEPREIDRIKGSLLSQTPVDEFEEIEGGIVVPKGSLHAKLLNFKSSVGEIKPRETVYASDKWTRDRTLFPWMSDLEFSNYLEKLRLR